MSESLAGHPIACIAPDSIADDLGLLPGDCVVSLDGQPIQDIFDYHLRQTAERVLLTVRRGAAVTEYEIEKEEGEDLGIVFASALLRDCATCENNCVFCFVDQLPPGMRETLYFKDDDLRLSFLSGNFATLTNLSEQELDRLISYRFSPMNVSVHATDDRLRIRLLRNRNAAGILPRLKKIAEAGLEINCQIVLVPGLNDGKALEQTLTDLTALGPQIQSIALVPVGVTRYRQTRGLFPISPYSAAGCREIVRVTERWQERLLREQGRRLVWAADEFYMQGAADPLKVLPPASHYEGFPQLENGVGMAALFIDELNALLTDEAIEDVEPIQPCEPLWLAQPGSSSRVIMRPTDSPTFRLATGTLAAPLMQTFRKRLSDLGGGVLDVQAIRNRFFGETVSVAGLLTGQDLVGQVEPASAQMLLVPSSLCKAGEPVLLDDVTLQELAERLCMPVAAIRPDAASLAGAMAWLAWPEHRQAVRYEVTP